MISTMEIRVYLEHLRLLKMRVRNNFGNQQEKTEEFLNIYKDSNHSE